MILEFSDLECGDFFRYGHIQTRQVIDRYGVLETYHMKTGDNTALCLNGFHSGTFCYTCVVEKISGSIDVGSFVIRR